MIVGSVPECVPGVLIKQTHTRTDTQGEGTVVLGKEFGNCFDKHDLIF